MERLFNIPLSLEIPFVKIKDSLTKKVIYKLYEESISSENNYIPKISKTKLINWIKNQDVQFNTDKKMYIKNNFKFLIFKIFIGDYITNSSKRHGIIIKSNGEYYTVKYLDGKIHSEVHRRFLYYSLPDLKVSNNPGNDVANIWK